MAIGDVGCPCVGGEKLLFVFVDREFGFPFTLLEPLLPEAAYFEVFVLGWPLEMWGAHVLVVQNLLFLFVDRELGFPLHIIGSPPPRGSLLRTFCWTAFGDVGAHVSAGKNFLFLVVDRELGFQKRRPEQ